MHVVLAANAQADQPWVVDAVVQLVKQTSATVAVVSVDELEEGTRGTLPRSAYHEFAERAADSAVERLRAAGVEASETVLSGNALERILEFAEDQKADLVVVGSTVRSPIASRFLGNVPLGLVERSKRPVLVVTNPGHA